MSQIVYLSLGGNLGDRLTVLQQTCQLIAAISEISAFEMSSLYETSPVSDIPQDDYINAVCRFKTGMTADQLLNVLEEIEKKMGKTPKPKNAPRVIDIDILFFGEQQYQTKDLEIPHPRWRERLFVIIPLLDLTSTLTIGEEMIDLLKLKDSLTTKKTQRVLKLDIPKK